MKNFYIVKPRGDEINMIFEKKNSDKEDKEEEFFPCLGLLETEWGEEVGEVKGKIKFNKNIKPHGKILKFLSEDDKELKSYLVNAEKEEKKAFKIFCELVKRFKLNENGMKPQKAYLTFDRKKIIFYYTAPSRVDFRELLRELIKTFPYVIRLQQISKRQAFGMKGGIGACGQELCCFRFWSIFDKPTKENLKGEVSFLSSEKLKGACGGLRCCLMYELENNKIRLINKEKDSKIKNRKTK